MSLEDVAKAGRIRGYWPLNEPSGIGFELYNGLHGADPTGVGSAEGLIYPLAREFVAANSEHLVVADDPLLDMPSSGLMTICGWAYANSSPTGMACLAKWGLPNGIVYNIGFIKGPPDHFRCLIGNADGDNTGAIVTDAAVNLSTGTWYFIRVEINENVPRTRIQVNESGYATITNPGWSLVDDGSDLWIGSDEATGLDFDGRLQGWALIEGVLTAAEISEIYNSGAGFDLGIYAPKFTGARRYYYFPRGVR